MKEEKLAFALVMFVRKQQKSRHSAHAEKVQKDTLAQPGALIGLEVPM